MATIAQDNYDDNTNPSKLNASVYDLNNYVENIKSRHIPEDDLTLSMGIYGYLGDINSNMLQNVITMAAEYSNEAIPIKAKFEKNIISHALALGIDKITAVPATLSTMIIFNEEELLLNMVNNVFTLDRESKIMIGDYEFHPEYDIKITRDILPDGEFIYTAMYDTSVPNPVVTDNTININPYLPPTVRQLIDNEQVVMVLVNLRQYEFTKIYKTILTSNPLENKMLQFEFPNQLAAFDIDVKEYGKRKTNLTPVYDGLNDNSIQNYCNYTYIDEKTIRVMFENSSYLPSMNTEVTVNLYTCQGSNGNFEYNDTIYFRLKSENYNYDRLNLLVVPIGSSDYGLDKKTIKELKQIIPKEALSRGSVTNSTDINNYFNSVDMINKNKMFFFKKMDNPLSRLYYAFLLMNTDTNIIPTNTIPLEIIRKDFDNISNSNYIMNGGNTITYDGTGNGKIIYDKSEEELEKLNNDSFVYINPFMCIVNKNPLYVSYYLNIMDVTKRLEFEFVNKYSKVQFIANTVRWYRHYFKNRDKYQLDITIMQNIRTDIGVIRKENPYDPNEVTGADLKVIAVLYSKDGKTPYRWAEGKFVSYDQANYNFDYHFDFNTNNAIDSLSRVRIENCSDMKASGESYGFMEQNTTLKIFVYSKDTFDYNAGIEKTGGLFPEGYLDGYSLTNIYNVKHGVDFLYNYSDIIDSNIKVNKNANGTISYIVDRVPVLGWSYVNSEKRLQDFLDEIEKKRIHIMDCLEVLEDSFGIDIKFFNTYGPSKIFYVDKDVMLNRCNLSLKFRLKFIHSTDTINIASIKNDIRTYIEDTGQINDIHIPNITNYISEKYKDLLVYFEFLDFNGYGPGVQHIYRLDESLVGKIPEFLNVNTANTEDNSLDISIVVA